MTPEQLERAKRVANLTEQLRAATSSCPASVIHGGGTRVQAWKKSTASAKKLMDRGCKDPARLSEALRDIRSCEGKNLAGMAEMAYGR